MTNEAIFEKVQEILMDQFDLEASEVEINTNMAEDIDADSLDLFEVLNRVEDDFDIKLEATESVATVSDLVAKIAEQVNK
ncbi:MAG: acyl carrier protein [Lactobacillaceae bacterium]|jgi:acyl carrier protein|nr:acyl carrier protein [Lactobacillaceae bacterium]